jgi:hypothetical protein
VGYSLQARKEVLIVDEGIQVSQEISIGNRIRVAALALFIRHFVPVAVGIFHIAMCSPVIPVKALSNINRIIK